MDSPVKTRYRIKTESVSYRLFRWADELSWVGRKQTDPASNGYVLKGVNCEAMPGEVTSIAGPSGAGKTTLLDILAGMVPLRNVSGRVLINDHPMNPGHFRRVSGYVTQDEALFPFLTVEETLLYSARLRLRGGYRVAAGRVSDLLKELGLEHVANVRVGGESSRGISGGEKRRVSIGVDLVHDPAVLLMDEPTSGLDSASALHIALMLKSMAAKQGKTIVLTIHQPGFRILELFDKILLLSNGSVLHFGSITLLEHRLRFAGHSIPKHVNVLEFAIEMTVPLINDPDETESVAGDNDLDDVELIRRNRNRKNVLESTKISYTNNWFKEVTILSRRFSTNLCRTKQLFAARTIQALVAGIVLGTIFMNSSTHKLKLQTQIGFFAFSLSFLLSSSTEGLPIFLQERTILTRETTRGAYRVSSYVVSNTLVFLPFLLTVSLLYATPVYWLVGLRRELDAFLYFSLVVWLVLLMSNSFVMCFSALVPNFIMGTSLIAGFVGSFFLFSGYFITKEDIPKYWIFMHYLSLFKYPFECFIINEYGGEQGKGRCVESIGGECFMDGDEFLVRQGLRESQKWSNVGVMLGFVAGYRLLGFLILWYRGYRTRN